MQKIFIVDDSNDLLLLFTLMLKSETVSVECCRNAASMFQLLQRSIPDLLIIDVMKTGVDENMICHDLKKRPGLRETPIIITSTQKDHIGMYQLYCADDAVEKPFEVAELRQKVRALLTG